MPNEPQATVRYIDGQLVLDDPAALGMIQAVNKHNCQHTLEINKDRVTHFITRIKERQDNPKDMVIVLLNADDPHGNALANVLMPNNDANWQSYRDQGQVPFARGIVNRAPIIEMLNALDKDAAEKLSNTESNAVLVLDHGVAEIFPV